jgi:formyltetrahydrofolate deformylase
MARACWAMNGFQETADGSLLPLDLHPHASVRLVAHGPRQSPGLGGPEDPVPIPDPLDLPFHTENEMAHGPPTFPGQGGAPQEACRAGTGGYLTGDVPVPRPMAGNGRGSRAEYPDRGRLLVTCPDRPGIVAGVTQFLLQQGANVVHLDEHTTDPVGGTFFMRIEFDLPHLAGQEASLRDAFAPLATRFGMHWEIYRASQRKRLAIFVSREDHCLLELLWRWRAGDLPVEIAMVVSNHPDLRATVEGWGIPFHHTPLSPETKDATERAQLHLVEGKVDLIVLARYMQVLSPEFVARWPHRILNIHHGFLPAFQGARPYDQAHARGVKLIGATAHYVTEDLDQGPIVEQAVERVDHRQTVDDLKRIGRYVERVVLARAVHWHVEDKVLVYDKKTVVFP